MSAALMIQGAGSNVGKSMLVAGLARVFARRGLRVRPFKPQNMSNNAAVTDDGGGEIGRAQALQARAAGVPTSIHMNPVLLKPESETGAQVIVQGKRLTTARARDYAKLKPQLLASVRESFAILRREADLLLVEGAGSPAEINLRAGDIGAAEAWWTGEAGLDTMVHYGNQAVFLSSGGYHHHIANNIWHSRGSGPRGRDRAGLSFVEMVDEKAVDERVVFDPWGNEIRFVPKTV